MLDSSVFPNFGQYLIADPYFTMKYLNHAKNNQDSQKLLINQLCQGDSIFSLYCCPLSPVQLVKDVQKLKLDCPSIIRPRECLIHCSYNGLAIIEISDNDRFIYLLWNPSIRESIVLPHLGCPRDGGSRFGLGYDSSSGGYKILHMHQNTQCPKYPNEILALKGGSWRSIDEHPRANRRWIYSTDYLPFIHAAFHWIQISKPEIIKDENKKKRTNPNPQNPLCVLKKFNPLRNSLDPAHLRSTRRSRTSPDVPHVTNNSNVKLHGKTRAVHGICYKTTIPTTISAIFSSKYTEQRGTEGVRHKILFVSSRLSPTRTVAAAEKQTRVSPLSSFGMGRKFQKKGVSLKW
ncbi:hypothetical protein MTR67_046891 [Solanum verrucosum]|uniref:F-box associated beta-propeller type 3 domain-containing protein n=1 Tax=Solanum verrucosum TaxID=315347 RepID=A0AAF0ZVY6_SOLVR|nr:hypothetical protein MTR67_046891 [Solanum verrucosum]